MGLREKQIGMGINPPVQPIGSQELEVQYECFLRASRLVI